MSAPAQPYRIDAARSQVLILVYRDGPMARLGHNHVLSVHALSGEVLMAAEPAQSSFSLAFPVAAISIDDPALRAQGGDDFKEPIDAAGIEGTRTHMLGEQLLDAARYPDIRVASAGLRAEADHWLVQLHITVRDHDCTAEVPMSFAATGDELSANGEFDLTHTQLGLTPYSVALGALRVAETIHIRYRVIARRAGASAGRSENP
ncbi:MAG TPA: YceI family protein [Steroidobacteraceae bacterium]